VRIEEIVQEWSKDCEIDVTNVSVESAEIAKMHNKYYQMYMQESMRLRKLKTDYKQLLKLKTEYYRGELTMEELRERDWEPQPLKILKQDIPLYIDSDQQMIDTSLKIGMQEEKVNYLENIIKMISNRGFQIKSIIDWERFRTGAM
jgi:hypothetical protein